ncbi:MAG TPA: RloB family protein [Solirubrobacterales bacterium]|nr:RloB family protein [Solirubrobacterales bacterium]
MRRSLLVFVEGAVTEEEYLNHIRRAHRETVTVQFGDPRGTPMALVKAAVAAKKESDRDSKRRRGRAYDEVWCVFDVDEHPFLEDAISLASDHGVNLAISSPCVELWFILHFADQSAYIERHDAQRVAESHLGCRKSLTPAALSMLEPRYEEAKSRAQALEAKHKGDGTPTPANPSSGVWQIVESIKRP